MITCEEIRLEGKWQEDGELSAWISLAHALEQSRQQPGLWVTAPRSCSTSKSRGSPSCNLIFLMGLLARLFQSGTKEARLKYPWKWTLWNQWLI